MKKLFYLFILSFLSISAFSQLRISQVYGGGGNATAPYKNDFVEIFNAGASSVALTGVYSIQYASAAGTSWTKLNLTGSIPAGRYFLIQLAAGGGGNGVALPAPDLTGSIDMSGTNGKVALVNTQTTLTGACPTATVEDFVGFGSTATCSETAPTAVLSNSTAALRNGNGCTDVGNNSTDFTVGAPAPRNSATAANLCSGAPSPALSATPNVTGLQTTLGTPSASSSFNLSGSDLTGFPGNITVTAASTDFEVSLSSGSGFSSSVSVPYTSAALASTPIYVRISATAPSGAVSSTVTATGGGAATPATVNVSGNVLDAEPTVQASNIVISNVTNGGFDINLTAGNGASRIVVVRASATAEATPTDGTVYTGVPNPSGNITGTNNFVVYSGTGTGPITVTGLTGGTAYTVRAYEYNGSTGTANYNITTATDNPATTTTTGVSPVLQQINFAGYATPLYMAQAGVGAGSRMPVMYYAKLTNLQPNTLYRYYTQGAASTDLGGTAGGAGNALLMDYTVSPVTYTYSSSLSLSTAGGYGKFTTLADGSFSGSFGFIPTTNARFAVGATVYPSIVIGKDATPTITDNRFALDQTVTVLDIAATPGAGTFIQGTSLATPGNLVALWKSTDGSSFVAATARPLTVTLAEHPTITGAWGTTFITGYDQTNGSWNAIIPNTNPAGVQLIQQLDISTGSVVGCNTDADGTWASGAITANPTGGTTPVSITTGDAPLNTAAGCFSVVAVTTNDFNAVKVNKSVQLSWTTLQEVNSSSFEILRSTDGVTWKVVATTAAAGNSNVALHYTVFDNTPATGRNLYRLRQVDAAGRIVLSNIKTVLFSDRFEISVSPNPVKNVINLNISKNQKDEVNITLYNSTGAVINKFITNSSQYSINAAGLNKGVYIIKVTSAGSTSTQKIVIN